MRPLALWPVFRVGFVCVIWIALCVLVPLVWATIKMRSEMAELELSASGGLGAVSVPVNTLVVMLPPVLFCLAWFIARRRNHPRSQGGPSHVGRSSR